MAPDEFPEEDSHRKRPDSKFDEIPMHSDEESDGYCKPQQTDESEFGNSESICELLSEIRKEKPFRKFVYKDTDFIEKIITKSDLSFRGACIQGDVRSWLRINSEDTKIYLLDNRTGSSKEVHFNPQGRLAGTNYWLRDHFVKIQPGMFLYLVKKEFPDGIIIIIDFFEKTIPFFQFLYGLYRRYKGLLYGDLVL